MKSKLPFYKESSVQYLPISWVSVQIEDLTTFKTLNWQISMDEKETVFMKNAKEGDKLYEMNM